MCVERALVAGVSVGLAGGGGSRAGCIGGRAVQRVC